jgi:hypothetical protein
MDKADEFYFGRNEGCGIFDLSTIEKKDNIYCFERGRKGCSPNKRSISLCSPSRYVGDQKGVWSDRISCYQQAAENKFSMFNPKNDFVCHEIKVF